MDVYSIIARTLNEIEGSVSLPVITLPLRLQMRDLDRNPGEPTDVQCFLNGTEQPVVFIPHV